MDFFAMKRKKLRFLCKKHRIPANWTSERMAEELSLIFKGREATDNNVEIINLDSESDHTYDVQMVEASSEENLQEGVNKEKGEKLSESTFVFEDTNETGKVGDEAETQDYKNSPDVSLLHTSLMESSAVTALVEQVNNLDENITDGKTNVTVEVNTNDLDAHQMVAPGTDSKSVDTCQAQKISIESSSKLISNSAETLVDDMRLCDVEENMQIDTNKDQVDHTQQVLHEEPSVLIMKDKYDLVHVGSENIQVDVSDTWQDIYKSTQKTGLIADDQEDCNIGYLHNNFEAEIQHYVISQLDGMESCNFYLYQVFASGTANGDEGTCNQEKLESARDIVGSDMKDDIKHEGASWLNHVKE